MLLKDFKITALNKNQILFLGFAVHILAAYFSIGYHQCDELFQIYEFAGYKLGINSAPDLAWEFNERMRSGIEPMLVYSFTRSLNFISITNPFTISAFLRIFQAILSFLAIKGFLEIFEKEVKSTVLNKMLWFFGLMFWCLPYFHARLSAENFSSTLFMFGAVSVFKALYGKPAFLKYLIGGLLMGIAFSCRFQISFMIAGFMAWLFFISKMEKKYFFAIFSGFLVSVGLGLLADYWLYSAWTLSWWNYLDVNFFKDVASNFGKEPVYYFISESFLQLIPPFSLVILAFLVMFWIKFRAHVLTWITVPFIFLHFFVPHKELRFLFPVLNFLPLIVILYLQTLSDKKSTFIKWINNRVFISLFFAANYIALAVYTFAPANSFSLILKEIYAAAGQSKTVLIYKKENPYNPTSSLNFFRNSNITVTEVNEIKDLTDVKDNVLYFSEEMNFSDSIKIDNKVFSKVYCNYPKWFSYLNFNGWLDRSVFSIYRMENSK